MNRRRVARLICRVFGHSLDGMTPPVGLTMRGCHRCGLLVPFRRGLRPGVFR